MRYLIFFLLVILTPFISCVNLKTNFKKINITINNNTTYNLTNILLFGTKFNPIPSKKSSSVIIDKSLIIENAIFSLDSDDKTFTMYIDNSISKKSYIYQIDSLNFDNRIIYFTLK